MALHPRGLHELAPCEEGQERLERIHVEEMPGVERLHRVPGFPEPPGVSVRHAG